MNIIKRIQFEAGKFFYRNSVYYLKNGVVTPRPTIAKDVVITGKTRVNFLPGDIDHCAGGCYTRAQIRRRQKKLALAEKEAWSIGKFDIRKIHASGITGAGDPTKGEGIVVVVLDTGGCPNHEDHQGIYLEDLCKNFSGGEPTDWTDGHGHGTHCIGIIAAQPNDIGVIGIAPGVKIVALKVLDERGSGSYEGIIEALDYVGGELREKLKARGYKHMIISMSLGGPTKYDPLDNKIVELSKAGIYISIAAGNSGGRDPQNTIAWPGKAAGLPGCFSECVAAIDEALIRAYFSSIGKELTIAAPGHLILSTVLKNAYAIYSGTSMATPNISGVIALLIEKALRAGTVDKLSPEVMRKLIGDTANREGVRDHPTFYGRGVATPTAAIAAVQKL